MSITEGTQPAAKTWTGAWTTAQTTASFTPESGALLVALVSADGTGAGPTDSVTDSLSGTWTLLRRENAGAGTMDGVASVWCRDSPGTSLTVSVTGTGGTANGGQLVVRTLIGALPAANQNGATNGVEGDPTTQQVSVAAGTGNKIYGAAFNFTDSTVMTPLGNTTVINAFSDTTNGDTWECFKSTGDTAGTATYGYSTSKSGMTCAVEIKAAPSAGGGLGPARPGQTWLRKYRIPLRQQLFPGPAAPVSVAGDVALSITSSITADGIVGGPSPSFVVNAAAHQTAQAYGQIGWGFPDRPTFTARSSFADSGTGQATLAITAGIVADGVVTVFSTPTPTVVGQANSTALYARTYGQGMPIPAAFSRSGTADAAGGSPAFLTITSSITADGIIGLGPSPTYVVNDTVHADLARRAQVMPNRPAISSGSMQAPPGAGSATLTVTSSITAAGDATGQPSLTVTAGITADGIIGLGPSPTYVVNTVAVASALFARTLAFPNRPIISTGSFVTPPGQGTATLTVTATTTASGAAGNDPTLTVTAGITADGITGYPPEPYQVVNSQALASSRYYRTLGQGQTYPAKFSRSSLTDVLGSGTANLTVTAGIVAAGVVGVSSGATLAITATIFASPLPPAVPPITVTGSSSPAVTVAGSSSPATTATGTSAPSVTVR